MRPPKKRAFSVENFFKVVVVALWTKVSFGAARAADQFGLARDRCAGGEPLVARVLRGVNGLAIKLGEQDVADGTDDGFRRA